MKKELDRWHLDTANEEEFLAALRDQEQNSTTEAVHRGEMKVHGLDDGNEAWMLSVDRDIDPELTQECQQEGSQLYVTIGDKVALVDTCAMPSMKAAAGVGGPVFSLLDPSIRARQLNEDLAAMSHGSRRKRDVLLLRYGKLCAVRSQQYAPIPGPELMEIAMRKLPEFVGEMTFTEGHVDHGYISGFWDLAVTGKDVKDKANSLTTLGHHLADPKGEYHFAVKVSSNDSSMSSAQVTPYLSTDWGYLPIGDPVKTEHVYTEGVDPCTRFEKSLERVFPRFRDALADLIRLEMFTVEHPENLVVNLCNHVKIPKKYGEAVLERVMATRPATGAQLYTCFAAVTEMAQAEGLSPFYQSILEDKLANLLRANWSKYDTLVPTAWGKAA